MPDDLDQAVRRADPARWLASRFIADKAARADVVALYAFDYELARAEAVASQSLVAQIRLTWWRETLDEIFSGGAVRAHPTARALADAVRRHALPRAPLDAMIDGRIDALDRPAFSAAQALDWADAVAGSAAVLAARVLDPATALGAAKAAGRAWGLHTLCRAGKIDRGAARSLIAAALKDADRDAGTLSVAAFPAIAHAVLARDPALLPLGDRTRLLLAVARGRV